MPRGVGVGLSIDERLWPRLIEEDRGHSTPCWIWQGGTDTQGYGKIWFEGRLQGTHVVAYKLIIGSIPKGKELDHLCRVRLCTRPLHLEAVTPIVNKHRGIAGQYNLVKTHCKQGHPFNEENTAFYKEANGSIGRRCRRCQKAWDRKHYLKKLEEMTAVHKESKGEAVFTQSGVASSKL